MAYSEATRPRVTDPYFQCDDCAYGTYNRLYIERHVTDHVPPPAPPPEPASAPEPVALTPEPAPTADAPTPDPDDDEDDLDADGDHAGGS